MTDDAMSDFGRLRDAVEARVALGAQEFREESGRWTAELNQQALPFERILQTRWRAFHRVGQYLGEGMTHFTVIEGPWKITRREQ